MASVHQGKRGDRKAPSTIIPPFKHQPVVSDRQKRALRGPKRFAFAVTSDVRDAYAEPVQTIKVKGQRKRKHRDLNPRRFTTNLGGTCATEYVYGTG
jgi:hypothetical protein